LLNALSRSIWFGVSPQARSFTLGVDISPHFLPAAHFGAPEGSPKVLLIDLEGQGEKGIAQDVKLVTLPLFVSKIVIFNDVCPTGPSAEALLDALAVMMHAAQSVASRKDRKQLFGHLHIVLRDCPQDEELCRKIIFAQEDPNSTETDEHAEAVRQRNKIRDEIGLAFENAPRVWCLPKLPSSIAPTDYQFALPAYTEKINEMRRFLGTQLASPKILNGHPLTGGTIAALVPEMAKALVSDHPSLNPPTLMDRIADMEAERAVDEVSVITTTKLQELEAKLPVNVQGLLRDVKRLREEATEELRRRLMLVAAGQKRVDRVTKTLSETLENSFGRVLAKNGELVNTHLEKLIGAAISEAEGSIAGLGGDCPIASHRLQDDIASISTSLSEELINIFGQWQQHDEVCQALHTRAKARLLELHELATAHNNELLLRRRSRHGFGAVVVLITSAVVFSIMHGSVIAGQLLAGGGPFYSPVGILYDRMRGASENMPRRAEEPSENAEPLAEDWLAIAPDAAPPGSTKGILDEDVEAAWRDAEERATHKTTILVFGTGMSVLALMRRSCR
jgi:hypothetical protein